MFSEPQRVTLRAMSDGLQEVTIEGDSDATRDGPLVMVGDLEHLLAALRAAVAALEPAAPREPARVLVIEPHAYVPHPMHLPACAICGDVRASSAHDVSGAPAIPADCLCASQGGCRFSWCPACRRDRGREPAVPQESPPSPKEMAAELVRRGDVQRIAEGGARCGIRAERLRAGEREGALAADLAVAMGEIARLRADAEMWRRRARRHEQTMADALDAQTIGETRAVLLEVRAGGSAEAMREAAAEAHVMPTPDQIVDRYTDGVDHGCMREALSEQRGGFAIALLRAAEHHLTGQTAAAFRSFAAALGCSLTPDAMAAIRALPIPAPVEPGSTPDLASILPPEEVTKIRKIHEWVAAIPPYGECVPWPQLAALLRSHDVLLAALDERDREIAALSR